jgi:tRNA modification GTPase
MEGVRRARDRAASADLVLWLADASERAPSPGQPGLGQGTSAPIWRVRNKIDLVDRAGGKNELIMQLSHRNESNETKKLLNYIVNSTSNRKNESVVQLNESEFNISATTGEGMEGLLCALSHYAERFLAGSEQALVTRARQRRALADTLAALRRALLPDLAGCEDLLAEELLTAAQALGRLTGRVDVEDILDVIFRDFCIGK